MTEAATSLIAHLYSQGKLTTPRRENRKIRHRNEILKENEPASYVKELQIHRMTPKKHTTKSSESIPFSHSMPFQLGGENKTDQSETSLAISPQSHLTWHSGTKVVAPGYRISLFQKNLEAQKIEQQYGTAGNRYITASYSITFSSISKQDF
jgi:hypothetical protein